MINVNLRMYDPTKEVRKSCLYKINRSCTIEFVEHHEERKEIVNVEYCLVNGQYGIYAKEYRRPDTLKEGCKTADVLACVVDENTKEIYSIVFDVKSNISAFSDDLLKEGAVLTATKEVRDFIEQIHAEILHKKSFLLYYEDGGYVEKEKVGLVTKNFEPEKFRAVAKYLENLLESQNEEIPPLVTYKLKNNLRAYVHETKTLCDFADRKIVIGNNEYDLQVFLLKQVNETDFEMTIQMIRDTHDIIK